MLAALHLILHLVVPAAVARVFYPQRWLHAWLIMLATMVVDLDHLLATPMYAPNRCSIGFHPLHEPLLIGGYALLLWFPRLRLIGLGLLIHMLLDAIDCLRM